MMSRRLSKRRSLASLSAALLVALAISGGAGTRAAASAPEDVSVAVSSTDTELVVDVSGPGSVPYQAHIAKNAFGITIVRDGQTVLSTATNAAAISATRNGTTVSAGQVLDYSFDGTDLVLHAAPSDGGTPFTITATPGGDRVRWVAGLGTATAVTISWDLASAGHWYGNGEANAGSQPWPLDDATTRLNDTDFSPSSYNMDEPFWFTSKASGIWVDTQAAMTVRIDNRTSGGTKRADLTVKNVDTLAAVTFIERTPRDVFSDYIGIAGHPEKSDAPDIQFAKPVWNTWAMYSSPVTQANVVGYAENLKAAGLDGYAIQIDDRWSSKYGDFDFDPVKFPDPLAMSQEIHSLGFDLGLWVTLWINPDAANYAYARDHGYLLKSRTDPSQPCAVNWWNGNGAGIVDLANPDAAAWYRNNLHTLMQTYDIQGFKFDTRFFDPSCAGTNGLTQTDYQRLGAEFADEFDLQGVGIRVHWTGQQKYGFIDRAIDASPNFGSTGLGRSIRMALSLSVVGYPFVVTDMVGGSLGGNPTDEVLVRWAQAEVAMPFWYASTSPVGPFTRTRAYSDQTTDLYRTAIREHEALAPYILKQKDRAVATGEPIIKPLFFNYPDEQPTYTINDEWLLGDALLTAPVVSSTTTRNIYIPSGTWYDTNRKTTVVGPTTLSDYPAPMSVLPLFVNLGNADGPAVAAVLELTELLAKVTGVGPGTSLSDKITEIRTEINQGDTQAACNGVTRSFPNQVRAQTGRTITTAQAEELLSDAQRTADLLGCS